MRARYVNDPELLTPIGEFIAARLPHWQAIRDPWPWAGRGDFVFRVFGFKPFYRFALIDITKLGGSECGTVVHVSLLNVYVLRWRRRPCQRQVNPHANGTCPHGYAPGRNPWLLLGYAARRSART